jgi:hypothetical protein
VRGKGTTSKAFFCFLEQLAFPLLHQIGFAADELPVHYRGGVGKSEKGRVGRWESVSDVGVVIKLVLNFTK